MKLINFKELAVSVEDCEAILDIEIEKAKNEGLSALKVLHGYGSHGIGGVLLTETRRVLQDFKRKKKIKSFFNGDKWNLFDKSTLEILQSDKSINLDEDLNKNNPGITIIVI